MFVFVVFLCRTKTLVCELLAAMCRFPGGHEKLLSAMDNFKVEMGESHRFEYLVHSVTETVDSSLPIEYQVRSYIGIATAGYLDVSEDAKDS